MSILRRVTALVTALLLLRLTLAGGSAACLVHIAGTDGVEASHRGIAMVPIIAKKGVEVVRGEAHCDDCC